MSAGIEQSLVLNQNILFGIHSNFVKASTWGFFLSLLAETWFYLPLTPGCQLGSPKQGGLRMLLIRALIAYLSLLSKRNGLYGDGLSEIEMWLPATQIAARVVPHHEGNRAVFELVSQRCQLCLSASPSSLLPVMLCVVLSQGRAASCCARIHCNEHLFNSAATGGKLFGNQFPSILEATFGNVKALHDSKWTTREPRL